MRILDPANSFARVDGVRAERLGRWVWYSIAAFVALWALMVWALTEAEKWRLMFLALSAFGAYLVAVSCWVARRKILRNRGLRLSRSDLSDAIFLAVFALPAIGPGLGSAAYLALLVSTLPAEWLADQAEDQKRFRSLIAGQSAEVSRVYHASRNAHGERYLADSDFRYILQFSITSPESGRQLLGQAGFSLSHPGLSESEKPFHPRRFPLVWQPVSLSSNLEVWRANGAIAWLDTENLAVYVVLPPGWHPGRQDR